MDSQTEQRLVSLEASRQRWRIGLAVGAALLLLAAASPRLREVRAQKFILEDDAGVTRGVWSATADDEGGLSLYDFAGQERLKIATPLKSGAVLEMYSGFGKGHIFPQVIHTMPLKGPPSIQLLDVKGRPFWTTPDPKDPRGPL